MQRSSAALILAFVFVALLSSQQIPPASFSGAVHDVSKKQITLETPEGNLLEFDINKKTQVLRGKKEIAPEDLHMGDVVTIEARQEVKQLGQYFVAMKITVSARPKTD